MQEVYTVDQGDKLLSIAVGGSNVRTFGYDNDGRTTNDNRLISGSWQNRVYTYDIESRITNIDLPGTTADPSYSYNGLDTRVEQVISGNATSWKRSGAYVTDSVLNEGSTAFTPGVSSRSGSTSTFTHAGLKNTDRQSTTTALSATRQYDAFGNLITATGTWNTRFGYAGNFGYQNDDTSGLKLLGHRHYDPTTGRFLTRDPIKDGRNWYGYGGGDGNPLSGVDVDGLKFWRFRFRNGNGKMIEFHVHPSKREAKRGARRQGSEKPERHGGHEGGPPHWHPQSGKTNKEGERVKERANNIHHTWEEAADDAQGWPKDWRNFAVWVKSVVAFLDPTPVSDIIESQDEVHSELDNLAERGRNSAKDYYNRALGEDRDLVW